MKIYDDEKELVKKRIEEIRENKRTATGDRKIIIAAGEPVLYDDADEYKALNRMAEILEFGMKQISDWEYLNLREMTSLPSLDPAVKNFFKNPKDMTVSNSSASSTERKEESKKGDTPADQSDEEKRERPTIEEQKEEPQPQTFIDFVVGAKPGFNYSKELSTPLNDAPEIKMSDSFEEDTEKEKIPNFKRQGPIIDVDYREVYDDEIEEPHYLEGHADPEQNHNLKGDDEELIEVASTSPWKWVKDHKKQIIIALGLTALSVALVLTVTELLPAYIASVKASEVAGLASEMIKNATLHHVSIASEKLALHGANTALAGQIASLTGMANSFNTATGVWTIGTETLSQFAITSAEAAAAATSKVLSLKGASLLTGFGGIGLMGIGHLTPQKKTEEYKTIKNMIDKMNITQNAVSQDDVTKTAQMISNKIISSPCLAEREREILFKKLQKTLKNTRKNLSNDEIEKTIYDADEQRPESIDETVDNSKEKAM